MAEYELPDGTVFEVPDDAPIEAVQAAVRRRAYPLPPLSESKAVFARPISELERERSEMGVVDSAIQSANDVVRLIAEGLTFGWADKGIGAATGTGAEKERALTEESRRRLGVASPVIEIASGAALPLGLASKGLTLMGRFGTNAMRGVKGALARSALTVPEGAAYGAFSAAGHDRDALEGAKVGAALAPLTNLGFESIRGAVGAVTRKNVDDLLREAIENKDALYKKALKDSDVKYSEQGVKRLEEKIRQSMDENNYSRRAYKKVREALKNIKDIKSDFEITNPDDVSLMIKPVKGYSVNKIENSRQFINDLLDEIGKKGKRSTKKLLRHLKNDIDDILFYPQKDDIVSGNIEEMIPSLKEARTTHSRIKQAEKLLEAKEDAIYAGKGVNETNNTARNVRSELNRFRKQGENSSFTPEQNRMLLSQIKGNSVLKNLSRAAPQRNLLGAAATAGVGGLGYSAGLNPFSAIGLASIPAGANALSNKLAMSGVDDLVRNILQGGYKETAAQQFIGRARDAAVPAMMGAQGTEAVRGEIPDTPAILRALEKYKQIFLREEKK